MSLNPQIDDRQVERITSKQLKKFLEDPVRQKTQRHLGLYDEEETIEDLILREDEPFFSEFPVDYQLKMSASKAMAGHAVFFSRYGYCQAGVQRYL